MRRLLIAVSAVGALLVLTVPTAFAASAHFKKGGEPSCTFSGTTSIPVTCTGTLAGLGNQDLNIHLAVSGSRSTSARMGAATLRPGRTRSWKARLSRTQRFPRPLSRTGT